MFKFFTAQTHFSVDGKVFDQVDVIALGSLLGALLANLLMGVLCEELDYQLQ